MPFAALTLHALMPSRLLDFMPLVTTTEKPGPLKRSQPAGIPFAVAPSGGLPVSLQTLIALNSLAQLSGTTLAQNKKSLSARAHSSAVRTTPSHAGGCVS